MDFNGTIIELMGKTDAVTVDLTSFIPQLEATITEGLKKATGGRISAYVCDTKDIFKVADEEPLTGRRFGGSMFLDGTEYDYGIYFNATSVYGEIIDKKLHKGVMWQPLKDGNTNWCLETLASYRRSERNKQVKLWYDKLSDDDVKNIVDLAADLKEALDKANAKILFAEDGTVIVPSDIEIVTGKVKSGFVRLLPKHFAAIDLPHSLAVSEEEIVVAPFED